MEQEPLSFPWLIAGQWLIAACALVLAFTGISTVTGDSEARPARAETVHVFKPPAQPKPKPRSSGLHLARYFYFDDPPLTAKFMAEYLNSGPAFDDVVYDVVTPFEIMLHGDLNGSRFDLRLYRAGRQNVLLKNCMMGSCYSDWAGAAPVDREPGQESARSLLQQRVRAGVLRLG
jgi:hypothetical protein